MTTERRLIAAADGTRIFVELHGGPSTALPLLCLPGLTRNSRDFEPVVAHFAAERPVLTIDFRGRGRSDYAADPLTYRPDVELADTITVLAAFGIARVALLGTSRGGIVGMLMAAQHPEILAGLFLNDIGPRIEPASLLRILGYVGVPVRFTDWESAARAYADTAPGFSNVKPEQWLTAVKRAYTTNAEAGIVPNYDMRLAATLPSADDVRAEKTAELWPLLPALAQIPVTCLRGTGSDLLSEETLHKLKSALPNAETVVVPDRGHAPFLDEPESLAALQRWLARVEVRANS